jgi:hypothetical protein
VRLNRRPDLSVVHVLASAEERPAISAVPHAAGQELGHQSLVRYAVEGSGSSGVGNGTQRLPELVRLVQGQVRLLLVTTALGTNRHAISFFYFI